MHARTAPTALKRQCAFFRVWCLVELVTALRHAKPVIMLVGAAEPTDVGIFKPDPYSLFPMHGGGYKANYLGREHDHCSKAGVSSYRGSHPRKRGQTAEWLDGLLRSCGALTAARQLAARPWSSSTTVHRQRGARMISSLSSFNRFSQ